MKTKLMLALAQRAALMLLLSIPNLQSSTAHAQGTAFTYQGRLNDGANPATGIYDIRFTIYDLATNGTLVAGPVTNSTIGVSNGLFTVTLDFGAGVFTGPDHWLEIAVRPSGPGSFTALIPRQRITPAPYAIYAGAAGAYAGAIADGQLSGNIARLNGDQMFTGALQFANTNNSYSGTFTGSGAGITGVKLTSLNSFGAIHGGDFQPALAVNAITDPLSVAAGDVNGDGQVDLVCGGGVEPSVAVLTNNGGGGFAMSALIDTGGIRTSVALADLNGDGWLDLATVSDISRTLVVLTNNRSGSFNFYFTNALSIGAPQSVAAADVNGDGKLDLICYNTATLSVHTNSGSGRCFPASTNNVANSAGNGPNSLAVADVNGDGWVDAIVVNTTGSALLVMTNNRSGRFVASSTNNVGIDPRSVVAADVNRDGWVDLISGDFGFGTGNTLTVLTNNGSGGFAFSSAPTVAAVPFSGASVGAADLNQDGWADLFCANWNGDSVSVLLNNRNGTFGPPTTYGAGDLAISAIAADVNGDGMVDLISGHSGLGFAGTPNTLVVLLNRVIFDGSFAGNGAALTNLNATNITAGTLANARLAGTYSNALTLNNSSNNIAGTFNGAFTGSGTGLTNLTAASLATATGIRSFVILSNPPPSIGDNFGVAVAGVGNDRVLIGAIFNNTGASDAGAAYLFDLAGNLVTTITNPAPVVLDEFGNAVAAVGADRLLIGAHRKDFGSTNDAGAAYLFDLTGNLITTFTNPAPGSSDNFGETVAAVGTNRVLIGAYRDDLGATDAGTAYLFDLTGALITTFTNPAPLSGDQFGYAITAVGTNRVVIGERQGGRAFMFDLANNLLLSFTNPAPSAGDFFGAAVTAVGTNRVVIGSFRAQTGIGDVGAAYLFDLSGNFLTAFTNPTPADIDDFAVTVAGVGSDRVLIGAQRDDVGAPDAGAVYLFDLAGHLLLTITNPAPANGDSFGNAVASAGTDKVVIGAVSDDSAAGGAAFVYTLDPFVPGLIADGVRAGSIDTLSLADGAVTAAKIGGTLNAAQIPNLDASKIASGTLADARLSANIARLNTNQTFTATNSFNAVTIGGLFSLTPGTNAPTAGSTLTPTTSFVRLSPAAAVTLSATTAINNGATPGAVLILQGMNNVNTVTLNDGANVQLGAASRVLGQDDTLVLIWNGTDWIEVSSANN